MVTILAISQVIWSLDDKVQLQPAELVNEKELEDLLAEHIEILNPDWLLIGRQVRTVAGKYIDLLCMDHDGDLVVVELKKDLTPREVTAQAIDYASCMADLTLEKLAEQYLQFSGGKVTINEAYQKKYGTALDEDSINQNVKMVIVAAKMDDSTERIIRYLREKYEVDINIMFFNVVLCGTKRLISHAWFEKDVEEQSPAPKSIRQWNQEYADQEDFRRWRNSVGALLLLHKSINASLNDLRYEYKLSKYCSNEGNIYTESLGQLAYQNNPQFKKFIVDKRLNFQAYDQFGKEEIAERVVLLVQLVRLVWNGDIFE